MRNLIRLFLLLTIFGSAISLSTSCSEENDCSLAGRPMMYCALRTINPDTKMIMIDTIDSLTITALGTDSIILNNEKKVHKFMLPLRYTSDSTVFVLKYDPKRNPKNNDTIYIVQQNVPYFQSMECGYMMKQNILHATFRKLGRTGHTELVDSIDIRNKEANTNEIQNLQIFYKYRDRTPEVIQ